MKVFVELGACDFETLTPLLMSGWKGYFIEPIPVYMNSLRTNIQNQNLADNAIFEQSAITNYNGTIEMVYVTDPNEQWQRGISHVHSNDGNVSNFTSNLIYRNEFTSERVTVPSLTLNSFLKKHDINQIDLLKIDVEGHELIILENYDWVIKPNLLKIEHKFVNDIRLTNLLTERGYFVWQEVDDMYAFLK
jgi:FkbM family methyltransferase